MPVDNQNQNTERRWTTGAYLTLLAAVLFILLNIAQIIYRLTIPSLGWVTSDPDSGEIKTEFLLIENAVGVTSLLEPGDAVVSIEGIPVEEIVNQFLTNPIQLPNWQIGENVQLQIMRGGKQIQVEDQLVNWTPRAWLLTNFGNFNKIFGWLVTLVFFGICAFTFFNRPGNLAARFLFAFGIANLSIALGDSIYDYMGLYFNLPAMYAKVFFSNIVFAYLLAPSFLGFSLSFPHPKNMVRRQPLWLLVPFLVGSVTIVLIIVAPEFAQIGFLLTFVMLLLGVFALIHSGITMRDAISRAQLRWAIGGVILGVAIFLLNSMSNLPSPYREIVIGVAGLGFPIIALSLAIAIFRYRLFDIDVIVRKTLQYTLLTGLLALVYFGSVLLLQNLVETITGEQSPIVIVISTLGIAALFNPLRHRIQDFIDRRFYRKKYNAEQALDQFASTARDEVDLSNLTAALIGVVDKTIQPEHIAIWLSESRDSYQNRPIPRDER
ncbi:MAG: hypothetical protein ACWGOY_10305 [Anaerolineales bacterium]